MMSIPLFQNLAAVAKKGHAKKGVSGIHYFYLVQSICVSICLPCIGYPAQVLSRKGEISRKS